MKIIDLRSDTVTKPSKIMREVMMNAEVGDDVMGEDPSVISLEKKMAKMANKEAALFVSSGTQSNLLALLSHCERGDEYICGQDAHIYKYEAGGGAVIGSIQPQPIEFEKDATLSLKKIKNKLKPDDSHFAKTRLICIENTHYGKVVPLSYLKKVSKFAKKNNLSIHLDGARVFNAVTALDVKLTDITQHFDSVSICLSKGLGAPVGSVLLGTKEFIKKARRHRKMLGGGLRQSGILAAAGSYAVDYYKEYLQEDHKNAAYLTSELSKIKGVKIVSSQTNILFLKAKKEKALKIYLEKNNILISGYGELRAVTHRDVSKEDIQKVIKTFKEFYKK